MNAQKKTKTKTKGQAINCPFRPSTVPIISPKAPGATKIPGADALPGVKFRLILPLPTWNIAFPIPAKTTAKTGKYNKLKAAIPVKMHPNKAATRGDLK